MRTRGMIASSESAKARISGVVGSAPSSTSRRQSFRNGIGASARTSRLPNLTRESARNNRPSLLERRHEPPCPAP